MLNNIVFVWAGGTGMSGLAMMLYELWYDNIVCINDVTNDLTDKLEHRGLRVIIWHGNYKIDFHDFVIYADIQAIIDWPELTQSRLHQQDTTKKFYHITLSYPQFLAEISKYFISIGITGSNGKTSTSAMTTRVLSQLAPEQFWLWLLGGLLPNFDNNWFALSADQTIRWDITHLFEHIFNQKHQLNYELLKKYYFVLEAGEYKDHFLQYDLDYTLITNIVRDHRDYFKTEESYHKAFRNVIDHTRYQTILTQQVLDTLEIKPSDQILLSNLFPFHNEFLVGSYEASNAWLVSTLLSKLEIQATSEELRQTLSEFRWAGRRMEYLWVLDDKLIYSDYSHHAPALEWNIKALQKKFSDKKLCVIFQPHQAQRVLDGWNEFKQVLKWVDTILIYRLYTAREDFKTFQSTHDRLKHMTSFDDLWVQFAKECNANYITSIEDLWTQLDGLAQDYIIVYFSAGDLDREMRQYIRIEQ